MVAIIMAASSPCRATPSDDSREDSKSRIPDCMPVRSTAGTADRWFFTLKYLQENNPSVKAGIDLEKELYYRQQSASFIHDLGSRLQLTHLVMNVAIIYMHRFYVIHSFRRFHRNDAAAACLFLAAKVEEMPRKLEYIVKVSYALQHPDDPELEVRSNRYSEEAQRIITYENILLQTLGFDLAVAVPNQFVVKCVHMIKAPKELANGAYHFANDCLHLTTLCLRYRPSVVACISIFLACSWAKWEIPTSHEGKPWYYYVDNEVNKEILEGLAEEVVSVYQKCPERLKIKRYMAKREESGDASTAPAGGDSHGESRSSAPRPNITFAISKGKTGSNAMDNQKRESSAAVDASVVPKPPATTVSESVVEMANGEKKQKSETAKVDLKSYMDRLKEQRPGDQSKNQADSSGPLVRKSFMPNVSSLTMDGPARREDREGRHQRELEEKRRSHKPCGNVGTHRPDERQATKVEYDNRKRHREHDFADEREWKTTRIQASDQLDQGNARDAITISSLTGINGIQSETTSSQNHSNKKMDSAHTGTQDDPSVRNISQHAQLLKLQKLEKLKNMNMKVAAATAATSVGPKMDWRDKASNMKGDVTNVPPISAPPLPPTPPPPPPPPPPPS